MLFAFLFLCLQDGEVVIFDDDCPPTGDISYCRATGQSAGSDRYVNCNVNFVMIFILAGVFYRSLVPSGPKLVLLQSSQLKLHLVQI